MSAANLQAAAWATRAVCEVSELTLPPQWASESERREITARASAIPNGLGRFWQITAPNGARSHLYGTKHSNARVMLDLPPELEEALARARIIATESERRLSQRRFFRNDPLDSLRWRNSRGTAQPAPFEAEILPWVRTFYSGMGLSQPWTILTDVALADLLLHEPCNDFNAGVFPIMDDLILLEGLLAGAEERGLEPQGLFLTELSKPARKEELHGILQVFGAYTQPRRDSAGRQAGMALYAEGRLGEMMAWDTLYLEEVFGVERAQTYLEAADSYLLRDRNALWVKGIEEELLNGDVVMAVGAFHLPGETGLVALLRARGFTVERIMVAGERER